MKKSRLLIIIFIVIVVSFFTVQIFRGNSIETVKAVNVTTHKYIQATGFILRDEKIIDISGYNNIRFITQNGDKISKGSKIAQIYSDSSVTQLSSELTDIEKRILILENSMLESTGIDENVKLDELIKLKIMDITDLINNNSILSDEYSDDIYEMQSLLLRRNKSNIDDTMIQKELLSLKTKRDELKTTIDSKSKLIYSPYSGYFSSEIDGYEDILNSAKISELTYEMIQDINKTKPNKSTDNVKISSGFDWYLAANLSKEDVELLGEQKKVSLEIDGVTSSMPNARVYKLQKNSDGSALLILSLNFMNEKIATNRQLDVKIILDTYSGIKVPKEALRILDSEEGVYILIGQIAKFKPIEILYEDKENYIIRSDKTTYQSVLLGDDIVVKSKALEDRKLAE